MADQKIGDAANGTKSTLDGTEKIPITGTKNALVSGIKDYAKTIFDTLYSAFNHSHADSDNGGIVNHTVLTNAGTSLHVPTYSSDSTTFLNGMGEWTVPAGGVTLSSDSTQYYNGIGEFTVVTDALLSFTDITTNNVSISKHGFTPKLSADSTLFLNGQGEWTVPPGTAGGITYSSDSTEFLNGKGEFTVPAGGGGGGRTLISSQSMSGVSSVTFSSISGSYKKLILEVIVRTTSETNGADAYLQFNSDTTAANYLFDLIRWNQTGSANEFGANYKIASTTIPGSSAPANEYAIGTVEIVDYANTTTYKNATVKGWEAVYDASSVFLQHASGGLNWKNTAAINAIVFALSSGNGDTNAVANLYGE